MQTTMKIVFFLALCFVYCSSLPCQEITLERGGSFSSHPYVIFLYGPPGSGRSKIAIKIEKEFSIPHISFADLIFQYAQENSPLGQSLRSYLENSGDISDDQCIALFQKRLTESDCNKGCLIEGAPWSLQHAKALYTALIDSFSFLAINIDTDDQWLVTQVEKRLVCPSCGRVYNENSSLPQKAQVCDICSATLTKRQEDTPAILQAKLESYRRSIVPILEFFKEKNCFLLIEGDRTPESIFSLVSNQLMQRQIGKVQNHILE